MRKINYIGAYASVQRRALGKVSADYSTPASAVRKPRLTAFCSQLPRRDDFRCILNPESPLAGKAYRDSSKLSKGQVFFKGYTKEQVAAATEPPKTARKRKADQRARCVPALHALLLWPLWLLWLLLLLLLLQTSLFM